MKVYILSWAVVCSDWKPLITLHRKQEISSLDLGKMWQKKKKKIFFFCRFFRTPIFFLFPSHCAKVPGDRFSHGRLALCTLGHRAGHTGSVSWKQLCLQPPGSWEEWGSWASSLCFWEPILMSALRALKLGKMKLKHKQCGWVGEDKELSGPGQKCL